MTPLSGALGKGEIHAWRLDDEKFSSTWDSGEGAYRVGGRWNGAGLRAVHCAVDPSTAILEVAVHKTFRVLDTVPHVLTRLRVLDPGDIFVVKPDDIPNPNWLVPGLPSVGQQGFGDDLLVAHAFVLIPSAVSRHSWNLIFERDRARGRYEMLSQERFALDTRLHR